MARQVKCRQCGEKEAYNEDIFDVLIHITSGGNSQKKFIHKSCMGKYEEEKKREENEKKEAENLYEYVAKIHGLPDVSYIPSTFYYQIQDVRNGTSRYTSAKKIRYKQGVSYKDIKRAYEKSNSSIERVRYTKSFKSVADEMKYCFAIARNNIPDVMREKKRKGRVEKSEKTPSEVIEDREVVYKKKKDDTDISDFLG